MNVSLSAVSRVCVSSRYFRCPYVLDHETADRGTANEDLIELYLTLTLLKHGSGLV